METDEPTITVNMNEKPTDRSLKDELIHREEESTREFENYVESLKDSRTRIVETVSKMPPLDRMFVSELSNEMSKLSTLENALKAYTSMTTAMTLSMLLGLTEDQFSALSKMNIKEKACYSRRHLTNIKVQWFLIGMTLSLFLAILIAYLAVEFKL